MSIKKGFARHFWVCRSHWVLYDAQAPRGLDHPQSVSPIPAAAGHNHTDDAWPEDRGCGTKQHIGCRTAEVDLFTVAENQNARGYNRQVEVGWGEINASRCNRLALPGIRNG